MTAEVAVTPEAPVFPTLEQVREIVRRNSPSYWRDRPMPPELRLDDQGIGFDSVGLLEMLLDLERQLALALPPDLLLDDAMTLGGLHARLVALARTKPD